MDITLKDLKRSDCKCIGYIKDEVSCSILRHFLSTSCYGYVVKLETMFEMNIILKGCFTQIFSSKQSIIAV